VTYGEIAGMINLQPAGLKNLPTLALNKFTLLRCLRKTKE
jgi:hypothetical protein